MSNTRFSLLLMVIIAPAGSPQCSTSNNLTSYVSTGDHAIG
ncbi:hypothetical protein SAMN05444359_111143 [Neolewinella agarilytica]|uniref:Uncharacterized protein n=1 Tax=Neolewinella agarilytica TaxID=478744 RepID=A0A1H9GX07_9BACT|nr:hypothetical protein SAMN05444359_111143 [Neolewinella agarilytica]